MMKLHFILKPTGKKGFPQNKVDFGVVVVICVGYRNGKNVLYVALETTLKDLKKNKVGWQSLAYCA